MAHTDSLSGASQFLRVHSDRLHYRDIGTGSPIVFLHGNPTSSFLWRHILPAVSRQGRCLAVDLIGMGRSSKPSIAYRLQDHIRYVAGFLDALELTDITLVLHDWGVAIGLHLMTRWPNRFRGVAFMEGHLRPVERWADLGDGEALFRTLRDPKEGRRLLIDENIFIEQVLPSGVQRRFSKTEMTAYRAPFRRPEEREPIWRWVQEIPIEGSPQDIHQIVGDNWATLRQSSVPKLLMYGTPGAIIGADHVAWCQAQLTHLTTIDVGPGLHFLQEDQPQRIADALSRWIAATAGERVQGR
jgi:haloalkane dehalogenase